MRKVAYIQHTSADIKSLDLSSIVSWEGKRLSELKTEQLMMIFRKKLKGAQVHETPQIEESLMSRALKKIADYYSPHQKTVTKNYISKIVYLSAVDQQTVDDYTDIFLASKKDKLGTKPLRDETREALSAIR